MAMADPNGCDTGGTDVVAIGSGTVLENGFGVGICDAVVIEVDGVMVKIGFVMAVEWRMGGDGGGTTMRGAALGRRAQEPQCSPARRRTLVNPVGCMLSLIIATACLSYRAGAAPFSRPCG